MNKFILEFSSFISMILFGQHGKLYFYIFQYLLFLTCFQKPFRVCSHQAFPFFSVFENRNLKNIHTIDFFLWFTQFEPFFLLLISQGSQVQFSSDSTCTYPRSPALPLGLTAAVALMIAQVMINIASGCICCRRGPHTSNSNWTLALICFVVSW